MKIALLHASILPPRHYGGIERIVMALAAEYKRLGHQVVIASQTGSAIHDYEFVALPEDYVTRDPKSFLPADVDFLHSHQPLRVQPTLPFLVTIHGNGKPGETYMANSNFLSRSHCRDHDGAHYIYNGLDVNQYPFVETKDDYFVFLARAKWRVKNLRTCIDLARDLGVRLEVMGGSGISTAHVRYHGSIGEAEGKLEILSRAKALLYPTNWEEPFGLAVVEALACGTPVIASSNGAMPEIVTPESGFVCRTYEEFLEAGRRVHTIDPAKCRARAGFFSQEKMATEYLKLIDLIMQRGELEQSPRYNFAKENVTLLYKPTLRNRLRHALLGRV